jgi:hypothetical protein
VLNEYPQLSVVCDLVPEDRVRAMGGEHHWFPDTAALGEHDAQTSNRLEIKVV